MSAEVVELHNNDSMSPEETLKLCMRNCGSYEDVVVIGWSKDGTFFRHNSKMERGEANWLIDMAKQDVLNNDVIILKAEEDFQ